MDDSDNLTPEDRTNMNNYFGKRIDPHDWQHLKAIMEDNQSSSTTKRDILTGRNKNKRFYFIRAPQKNNKIPLSIIW
jgi:hypothetical protein